MASRVRSSSVGPRPLQRLPDDAAQSTHVVANVGDEEEVDAEARELLGQVLRVRIQNLAEQQLGSDGDDLCLHVVSPGPGPLRKRAAAAPIIAAIPVTALV
jgi:hypothetical protein